MRPAHGLKRKYPVVFDCTEDEEEYLTRFAYELKVSKTEMIRTNLFGLYRQWEKDLKLLRRKQKGKDVWRKRAGRKQYKRA